MKPQQPDLFPAASRPLPEHEIAWLLQLLIARDWLTAEEILTEQQVLVNESNKRRLRALASASRGRIAGGQKGYKLVAEMTADEFGHVDSWMASQEREMQTRRLQMFNVFHATTRTR